MSEGFYRAFEERYYAPREYIKSLRRQYLDFVEPLAETYKGSETFDAGCGRGEWLELMQEVGFRPFGVDLDEGMLAACHTLNLNAQQGDAIEHISHLPSASQAVITAFHVVEHISFEQLQILIREALRALRPGGLLILETPNPENIVVATRTFYLDPTHQKPIPSELLHFVVEYAGFARIKTLRLQERRELTTKADVTLKDVFTEVSPDYAIVAQKRAPDHLLAQTAIAFDEEYGISLNQLLARWDQRFEKLELLALESKRMVIQAEAQAAQAEAQAAQAEAQAARAEANTGQAIVQLHAVYASKSWRITSPLRKAMNILRKLLK